MTKFTFISVIAVVATTAFVGCDNSAEADDGYYCEWDNVKYMEKSDYDRKCVLNGKYCETSYKTFYTQDEYERNCKDDKRKSSSSAATEYCCEYSPDHCYPSIGIKNIYCPAQTPSATSSSSSPQIDYSRCENNSCYTTLIHSAAGSSMGKERVAAECRCRL